MRVIIFSTQSGQATSSIQQHFDRNLKIDNRKKFDIDAIDEDFKRKAD